MKVFIVCQIWDGDCICPDVLGVYATAIKANMACYDHVVKWAPDKPVNMCEGEALAHWEWDGGIRLESAKVIEFDLDVTEWPIGNAIRSFFREVIDCETFDYEHIHDGAFRRQAMANLAVLEGKDSFREEEAQSDSDPLTGTTYGDLS